MLPFSGIRWGLKQERPSRCFRLGGTRQSSLAGEARHAGLLGGELGCQGRTGHGHLKSTTEAVLTRSLTPTTSRHGMVTCFRCVRPSSPSVPVIVQTNVSCSFKNDSGYQEYNLKPGECPRCLGIQQHGTSSTSSIHVQQDPRPLPSPRRFPKLNDYHFFFSLFFFFFILSHRSQMTKENEYFKPVQAKDSAVITALHRQQQNQYPKNMQPAGRILISNKSRSTLPPNKNAKRFQKERKSCQWVSPFVPRSRAPQSQHRKQKENKRASSTEKKPGKRGQALSFFLLPPPP